MKAQVMQNNNNFSGAIGSILGCIGGTAEMIYLQYFADATWWLKIGSGILAAFLFAIAGKLGADVYLWVKKQFKLKKQ